MLEQNAHASELDHPRKVLDVTFPSGDEAPRVVQPGEDAFHDRSPFVTPQRVSILCGWTHTVFDEAPVEPRFDETDFAGAKGRPRVWREAGCGGWRLP